MRALITGATGFAGPYLAEHLLASGDEVLGCSRSGRWPADAPEEVRDGIDVFSWDVSDGIAPKARDRIAAFAPEAIYHLAAISVPSQCGDAEPNAAAVAANITGAQNVVDLAASLASKPRVLLVSSCYVYAPVSADDPVVDEDAPLGPVRAYGKTKLAAEQLLQKAIQADALDGLIARAFQHTGPRQSAEMILPDWAQQFAASSEEPIRVVCRDTYLDLSDVRDVVRAYRQIVVDGNRGTVYNVGSGIRRRSGDLLDKMRQMCDPQRETVEISPGTRQHPIANILRLTAHTGWRPSIPIEQTLNDIINYWLTRKRGL